MNEQELDAVLAVKTKAARVTPEIIDGVIKDYTFTVLPSGKVMICEITLTNGFTVRGEASVVSKENFIESIGKDISYKNARNKIWELEGYLLQEDLHRGNVKIT